MHGFNDRALALLFAIGLLLFGTAFAGAGPYEDAVAGLTTDSFGDTADAIEALTASSDPRTSPLLEALKEQRLLYSAEAKRVFQFLTELDAIQQELGGGGDDSEGPTS